MNDEGREKLAEAATTLAQMNRDLQNRTKDELKLWNDIHELQVVAGGLAAAVGLLIQVFEMDKSASPDLEALSKLGELKESGILTAEEFETQKARILS
jgi:hypothetical protein